MVTTATHLLLLISVTICSNEVRSQNNFSSSVTVCFSGITELPVFASCKNASADPPVSGNHIFRHTLFCQSLNAALQLVSLIHEPGTKKLLDVAITLLQTENNTVEHLFDTDVQNMAIFGLIPSNIFCNRGGSFLFRNVSRLTLANLTFVQCGSE